MVDYSSSASAARAGRFGPRAGGATGRALSRARRSRHGTRTAASRGNDNPRHQSRNYRRHGRRLGEDKRLAATIVALAAPGSEELRPESPKNIVETGYCPASRARPTRPEL